MQIHIFPIDRSSEEMLQTLQHPEYFADKVRNLKPESRRLREILAVRCALKEIFGGVEQEVGYTEDGAPYLLSSCSKDIPTDRNDAPTARNYAPSDRNDAPTARHHSYLSISHTQGYGAIIIGDNPVGIDIEHRGNRVENVVSRFLQAEEIFYIQQLGDTTGMRPPEDDYLWRLPLHLAWSAKEAAFKVLGKDYYDLHHLTAVKQIDFTTKEIILAVQGRENPLLLHFDYTDDYVTVWLSL